MGPIVDVAVQIGLTTEERAVQTDRGAEVQTDRKAEISSNSSDSELSRDPETYEAVSQYAFPPIDAEIVGGRIYSVCPDLAECSFATGAAASALSLRIAQSVRTRGRPRGYTSLAGAMKDRSHRTVPSRHHHADAQPNHGSKTRPAVDATLHLFVPRIGSG